MKPKFRSFEELLDEYLENPEFAMSFLNQALADEDIDAFKLSLTDIIRARGKISLLAKKANLSRGTLYKLMDGKGATEVETVIKLLHALGYDLTVTQRPQTSRARRQTSSQPLSKKRPQEKVA
jgi:probable addiction module antidote protein